MDERALAFGRQMIGVTKAARVLAACITAGRLPHMHEVLGSVPSTTHTLMWWHKPAVLSYVVSSCLEIQERKEQLCHHAYQFNEKQVQMEVESCC